MKIVRDTLRIEEIANGFALYGNTPEGESTFLAHLGDGVDGLPDPCDPNLPEEYDFELVPAMVECPECGGAGMTFPRATCGMWSRLVPWSADVEGETCGFCDGTGEITAEEAEWYEQAIAESFAD